MPGKWMLEPRVWRLKGAAKVDELFTTLLRCCAGAEMTRLWLAAFCLNHWPLVRAALACRMSPWRHPQPPELCGQVLQRCHSLAFVLGDDAESLRRQWCLYEAVLAADRGPPKAYDMDLDELRQDGGEVVLTARPCPYEAFEILR